MAKAAGTVIRNCIGWREQNSSILLFSPRSEVRFCFSGHKLAHMNLWSKLAFRRYGEVGMNWGS